MIPTAFPEPQIFFPGQGEPVLRWGIIGPGSIAGYFAAAVNRHTHQKLMAVSSRSISRATSFAAEHGAEHAYGSTLELVEDPDVDVVYIASPHSEHLELGLLAIAAGKHVLVEKPMATSADDARVFFSWKRCGADDGMLGEIVSVTADHGQSMPVDHGSRMYRKDLAGGALLDLGIYPIQLDSMVLGAPTTSTAIGAMTETGVDAYATLILGHEGNAQSTLTTSMLARTPGTGVIAGRKGRLEIAGPFHVPTSLSLHGDHLFGPVQTWTDPTGVSLTDGLAWEVTALARYVGEGRSESPLHTWDETVSILETIDEARLQVRAPVGLISTATAL